MKTHYLIKLNKSFCNTLTDNYPYWKEIIMDKSSATESFYPDFDNLFKKYNLKFWVTKEYKPANVKWDNHEITAGLNLFFRIILQKEYDLPSNFVNQLRSVPYIEQAEEMEVVRTDIPTPPVSIQQSLTPQKAGELIYLNYAKAVTKGNPELKIAVLDTGINLNHRELQGKIVDPADFVNIQGLDTALFIGDFLDYDNVPEDEVGHGTHVSGVIAARGVEMDEGVSPDCKIMPVRVLATMKNGERLVGAGIIDNINTGIKWAVDHGANVINMSLGIRHTGGGLPHEHIIKYALNKNVTIVAASGNDGTNEKYYPGALPGVIAVGAVDNLGNVTSFSSYGAEITVVAPGLNIYSSYTQNTYAFASGTSQASPFVCGSVALMKSYAMQRGKTLTNDSIRYILENTSDRIDNRFRNQKAGFGVINLADAFKLLNYIIN